MPAIPTPGLGTYGNTDPATAVARIDAIEERKRFVDPDAAPWSE